MAVSDAVRWTRVHVQRLTKPPEISQFVKFGRCRLQDGSCPVSLPERTLSPSGSRSIGISRGATAIVGEDHLGWASCSRSCSALRAGSETWANALPCCGQRRGCPSRRLRALLEQASASGERLAGAFLGDLVVAAHPSLLGSCSLPVAPPWRHQLQDLKRARSR
jgi:hypothetical protein